MQGKVRVGRRCGELKVCWDPIPQYISLHLPHSPLHILSPHTSPLTPYTFTLSHSPHTLSHTLPTHLSLPPPTPQHISLYLPHTPHIFSHSSPDLPLHPNTLPYLLHALSPHLTPRFDYVAKLPCDDVTLMNLTRKAR